MLQFSLGFNLITLTILMLIQIWWDSISSKAPYIAIGLLTLILLLMSYWTKNLALLGLVTGITVIDLMLTHQEMMN